MTPQNFCYWLQGFFEITGTDVKTLNEKQINMIKSHLRLVFRDSIDPSMGNQEHQNNLNAIHQSFTSPNSGFPNLGPLERC